MGEQAEVRERLEDDRATTVERLEALRRGYDLVVDATEGSNADDEHDPEGSTIAYERSQLSALVDQAVRHLGEIEGANVIKLHRHRARSRTWSIPTSTPTRTRRSCGASS